MLLTAPVGKEDVPITEEKQHFESIFVSNFQVTLILTACDYNSRWHAGYQHLSQILIDSDLFLPYPHL